MSALLEETVDAEPTADQLSRGGTTLMGPNMVKEAGREMGLPVALRDLSRSRAAAPLVQICPCYVDMTAETGGVANIVRQICLRLSSLGRPVDLLCGSTELGKQVARPGLQQFGKNLRVEVIRQRWHPLLGPTGDLVRRLKSLAPGSIGHVHGCFSAFTESAMTIFAQERIPFVFTPHGKLRPECMHRSRYLKGFWFARRTRRRIAQSSMIAVSSEAEATDLRSLKVPAVDTRVIPNGYEAPDPVLFPERPLSDPYVLFLGYLDPRKQPDLLIRAFARSRSRQSHRLVIAGPDAYGYLAMLRAVARQENVTERVLFVGPAYGARKWSLLLHAQCFCLPSRAEGLPTVLCEALGAGLPVVCSTECNFPEVADNGAGLAVHGNDPGRWASALDSVCLDELAQSRMRDAAKTLRHDYTWHAAVTKWCQVYDSLAPA